MKALIGFSKFKRIKLLCAGVLSAFLLTACSSAVIDTTPGASETPSPSATTTAGSTVESNTENGELALIPISVEFAAEDEDISWSYASATKILLNGDSATVEGSGAKAEGGTVTITGGGTYVVSGTLTDGKLVVDSSDKSTVKIVLNDARLTSSSDAVLHVLSAEKTMIILADGTENTLEDGATRASLDDSGEPDGALFSKDDLVIAGNGSLTVKANYDDGIVSKDGLWITGGKITVDAAGDGIRGKDFLVVKVADITVTSQGEALKSTEDSDSEKGYVYIESGIFTLDSQQDAIEAVTQVIIKSGDFNIKAGGGSENGVSKTDNAGGNFPGGNATSAQTDTVSTKGIKADVGITIDGGTFNIDTADDAIHTNNSIVINGGVFNITTGDDGIHSDTVMTLNGGEITILKSYEGIESANVTINDGIIRVTASDDGINIAGGNDGSSVNGRPGQNSFTQGGNYLLTINGGYITVDAGGDGLDSNGSIVMEDGIVIVNGPTNSGNGAMDYDGTFTLNGGYLVAAGSAGMAQAPSDSSSQASMLVGFDNTLQAGTVIRVEDSSGKAILTFAPSKQFQTFVLSSPELKSGSQYTVYYGGSSSGIVEDGLYSEGTYSGGTKLMDITLSGTVTTAGTTGGGFGGGGFGGGGGRR